VTTSRLRAAFFDFDGVILESADVKTTAFGMIFADRGREVARRFLEHHIANAGRSRYEKFAWAYEHLFNEELCDDEMARLDAVFSGLVDAELATCAFVPGAVACLRELSGEVPCMLVSATPERDLLRIAVSRGVHSYFTDICGSPITKVEHVGAILERRALDPRHCVFVGDTPADFGAASAHAIPFVGRVRAGHVSPFLPSVPTLECLSSSSIRQAWASTAAPSIIDTA
jgi:phosphoglycolate phosphatase-like HAD superfamily hydrolase